jgi:hypothetical protein
VCRAVPVTVNFPGAGDSQHRQVVLSSLPGEGIGEQVTSYQPSTQFLEKASTHVPPLEKSSRRQGSYLTCHYVPIAQHMGCHRAGASYYLEKEWEDKWRRGNSRVRDMEGRWVSIKHYLLSLGGWAMARQVYVGRMTVPGERTVGITWVSSFLPAPLGNALVPLLPDAWKSPQLFKEGAFVPQTTGLQCPAWSGPNPRLSIAMKTPPAPGKGRRPAICQPAGSSFRAACWQLEKDLAANPVGQQWKEAAETSVLYHSGLKGAVDVYIQAWSCCSGLHCIP